MSDIRYNWTKEEVMEIYNKPLMDLLYEAATIHRQYHDPNTVQVSTLLSVKTGGLFGGLLLLLSVGTLPDRNRDRTYDDRVTGQGTSLTSKSIREFSGMYGRRLA